MSKKIVTFVGTYRKPCLSWIKEKRLYNIPVFHNIENALEQYKVCTNLWLIVEGEEDLHFKLKNPKLVSLEDLRKVDYPCSKNPHSDTYVLFELSDMVFNPETPTNYAFIIEDFAKNKTKAKLVNDFLRAKVEKKEFSKEAEVKKILPDPILSASSKKLIVYSGTQMYFLDKLFSSGDESFTKKEGKKLTTLELFAGAGGLALGIDQAGFNTLACVEFDKDACATLRKNRPNWTVIEGDIAQISNLDLEFYFNLKKGELDLLSGGAPCQAFSYAGKKLGLEDARGTLFYHYAVFLNKLQPKMFLFENVRGLLSHDNGKTYKLMLSIFEQAGYSIQKEVLNAWDYGVAQKRERLITIGIRKDLVDTIKFAFPKPHKYKPVLRDVLLDCPKGVGIPYSDYKRKIYDLVPPGGYWRDIPEDIAKEYMKSCWEMEGGRTGILRRLSLDEPSLTVLTSPSQKQTDRCHPIESRPFTVRENARCQSFPDSWEFCGSIASQYKQVGNAVPVNLAHEIATQIMEALKKS